MFSSSLSYRKVEYCAIESRVAIHYNDSACSLRPILPALGTIPFKETNKSLIDANTGSNQ